METVPKFFCHYNEIDVFGVAAQNSCHKLLTLNPFISKNYFSRYQHSFFFSDEKITCQTFYSSADYPSIIVGTDYGRIFIVQLFQDIEGRAYPVVVIDSHFSAPIASLYIAYSTARKSKRHGAGTKVPNDQKGP